MTLRKIPLAKRIMVAWGLVFLFMPTLIFAQSSALGAAAPPPTKTASTPPQPDMLEGLTLTNDQKLKIDQIREDTKSRVATAANDPKLSPEVKDAMLQGYHRIENGKILEVLTPEQKRDVRRRIQAWRAEAQQHQGQFQERPGPATSLQPK